MTIGEPPRLYSKPSKLPADVLAEQHREIHPELERWGAWNAERYEAASCSSVESRYREQTASTTGSAVDPRLIAIERAVLRMPRAYRDTIRLFYVQRASPSYICRMFALRPKAFPAWMFACRAMVINLLRRHGN